MGEGIAILATASAIASSMLPPNCRWICRDPGYATLDWNYGCVAAVRQRDGYVETRVIWQRWEHYGKAASMAQGRRFVERWIAARKGFPGYVSRNPIKGWAVSLPAQWDAELETP